MDYSVNKNMKLWKAMTAHVLKGQGIQKKVKTAYIHWETKKCIWFMVWGMLIQKIADSYYSTQNVNYLLTVSHQVTASLTTDFNNRLLDFICFVLMQKYYLYIYQHTQYQSIHWNNGQHFSDKIISGHIDWP